MRGGVLILTLGKDREGGVAFCSHLLYNICMPYKTGTWGKQAKERSKKRNEYFLNYKKKRDPLKLKARSIINYLVSRGVISKQPCTVCGTSKVEAHHPDYLKPLEVVWLCSSHHREEDRKLGLR